MKQFNLDKMIWYVNIVVFVICFSLVSHALAQSGGAYELADGTINAGGGMSSGGPYRLVDTIAPTDGGDMSGGDFTLFGGRKILRQLA